MADTKISALTAALSVADADLMVIVQGGVTKRSTAAQVRSGFLRSGAAVSVASLSSPVQYAASVNGDSVQIADAKSNLIIEPAGTIATLTITMPAIPTDGQEVRIAFTQIVTTITHAASGADTLKAPLTTATANSHAAWVYRLATTTWYRID